MKSKKGFTLIELIIVMAVTTILLGTIVAIFIQSIDYYKTDEVQSANQASLNVAVTKLDSSIRKATNVYNDANGCHVVYAASEDVFSLNTTTKVLSLNSSYLTDRITTFTCSISSNVVTIFLQTINDRQGIASTSTMTIVLRKGD